jgi:hypothetical protein
MRDLYSDDYDSVAGDGTARLIPDGMRRAAGATVFLGLVAALAVWAWNLGTRDAAEVPVIRAMEGPARVEPEDPGGLQASHQGLEVNSVLAGDPEPAPREIPVAEPPPAALAVEDGPQGELVAIAPPAVESRASDGLEDASPEPVAAGPVASRSLAALVAEAVGPAETLGGDAEAEADPEPAPASSTLNRPRVRPDGLRAAPQATAAIPAATPVAAQAAAPREVAAGGLGAGTRMVQLGAYDSEELTRQAWASLVARHGALLGSKSLYVERTTSNARVFYRLRVAGFDSTDQTRDLCEALRAQGVDCIPVTLQ